MSAETSRKSLMRFIAFTWVGMIVFSIAWNWYQVGESALMFATSEASTSYNKDLVYRRWSSLQGGVYVEPTQTTPPNPYLLHHPGRDLVTTKGKHLTLINPAYMTRQVHELGQKQYGAQGHITSLKPLNPNNSADPWETEALQLFATGSKEVVSKEMVNGQPYLRLMRPLVTEKSCLQCHAVQGYKEGEIRGGISVSVPFSPYAEVANHQRMQLFFVHLVIGALALLILWKGNNLISASEAALLKSETKYRSAYTLMRMLCDNVPDMIWAKDLEKRFLFANKAVCRDLLKATDTDEPIGRIDMYFVERERKKHPDDPHWHSFGEICGDTDTITMEAGIPKQFDEYGNVQGKFLYLDVHKAPFMDENGTMIGTVGSGRDVTVIKAMERQLQENEKRLTLALYGADLGIWDYHIPSGAIVINKRCVEMLGYTIDEIEPHIRAWRALVHKDDMMHVMKAQREHFAGRTEKYKVEHRLRHKSGSWIWVLSKGCVIERDAGGKPIRACGTHLDVTERKHAEEEKNNLQVQLVQAHKMQAIGTLAGGIAHDFNNILGAILGYAEMSKDPKQTRAEVTNNLDKVLEAGHRAAALVKQILTFSRQSNTERIPLLPGNLIKETIKLLRPALPANITIKQQLSTTTKTILADPTQIHQIVMNLCTNALHAMEQTGGKLDISLKDCELVQHELLDQPEVQPGAFVVLTVIDSGPGVAPEVWGKIFDPFFTTKEIGKGTGMGLAITHGIVTSYGGFITCQNNSGNGAAFRVYFPALEQDVTTIDAHVVSIPTGKEHILYIDDEEMLVELGKVMFQQLGYEVTACTSSLEALQTFQKHPDRFDAVITDQTMPGITGMDLTTIMLQIRPDIPIILCTGFSSLISEEQAKNRGVKGFVMKPYALIDIAPLLREVLDEKIV